MIRKALLVITAVVEAGAGFAFLVIPMWAAELLFGEGLSSPAALAVARIAGSALLSLAVACWICCDVERVENPGIFAGLTVYNLGVPAVLVQGWWVKELNGVLLWPAVILHAALALWCIAALWRRPEASISIRGR
jgi:hypothetical protein